MFLIDERFALAYILLMCIPYLFFILIEQKRLELKVYIFFVGSIVLLVSLLIAFKTHFISSNQHLETERQSGIKITKDNSFFFA